MKLIKPTILMFASQTYVIWLPTLGNSTIIQNFATLPFMLTERRDTSRARSFFKLTVGTNGVPDRIAIDKSGAVPDFSTLPRRGNGLTLRPKPKSKGDKPMQLVMDSTGLKIFGEGEWLEKRHKTKRKRRSWRKLHLGLDLVSCEIVCSDLTTDDVGDPTALPDFLD